MRVGDRLQIDAGGQRVEVEVLGLPQRPVPRDRRAEWVRVVGRRPLEAEALSFDDEP